MTTKNNEIEKRYLGNIEEAELDDRVDWVCGHYEKHRKGEHFCLCKCCEDEK